MGDDGPAGVRAHAAVIPPETQVGVSRLVPFAFPCYPTEGGQLVTDTQRPSRPTTRAVPARPGFEPEPPASDDSDLAPARKSAPRKKPAVRKPSAAKATVTKRKPPPKRAPARRTGRDETPSEIDFTYEDPPRRAVADEREPIVRPNGDIHLALADEAWWIMPNVCAKTGEPAKKTITYAPTGAPKWAYLSFLLGILPGYLILRTTFPSARLPIPFSNRVRRRRSLWAVAFIFGFSIGLPCLIGGAATATPGTAIFGAALLAGSIVAVLRARTRVKVRIAGPDVVISGAHPAFATALAMQPTPDEQRTVFENTSGAGKAAVVPIAVRRFNWGAFFLTPIWAIANGVWIGLLGFVPFVNLVMAFVLGFKGNAMAWRKKRWESVEEFLTSQKHWALATAALFAASAILYTIYSVATIASFEPRTIPRPYGVTDPAATDYASGIGGVKAGSEYGFTATFPAAPSHEELTEQAGQFELHIDVLQHESDDAAFSVGVVTYPSAVDVSDPAGLLRAVAQGSAGSIPGGELVRYSPTTVGGDPAAGTLVSGSDGVFVRQRYVLHGHTLFTIQVASASENPPGFGRFVDSFKVL